MNIEERLDQAIRNVPDFPKPGIMFKDITTVLKDPVLSADVVEEFKEKTKDWNIDAIVGVESRGFLYGMPLAIAMNVPFITVRKQGKLPYKTITYSYDLEYGSATIEMHVDALQENWNVLVHDDLLATGGTAAAAAELIQMQKANVAGFAFMVDLKFLNGAEKLHQYSENIVNLVAY